MLTFLIVAITICILFLIAGVGLGMAIQKWKFHKKDERVSMTKADVVEDASEGRR